MTTSTTRTREREESVGIRCFVGPRLEESEAGVGGTFKHRYTDFVVREVDLAGTTAELTVLGPVPGAKGGPTSEVTADAKAEDKSEPVEEAVVEGSWLGDAAALKELEEAVGASDAKRFREFVGRNTPTPTVRGRQAVRTIPALSSSPTTTRTGGPRSTASSRPRNTSGHRSPRTLSWTARRST